MQISLIKSATTEKFCELLHSYFLKLGIWINLILHNQYPIM